MTRLSDQFDYIDVDDFDALLADKPQYVLLERDRPLVEGFDRHWDAWFASRTLERLEASLDLPALGLTVPLAEIYQDVPSA